jgi:hypothetical protein
MSNIREMRDFEVRSDLRRALDELWVEPEARRFISLHYEDELTDKEAAAKLGFSTRQTENVTRSLRGDRAVGELLRAFLGAYKKNKKACPRIR